MLKDDISDITVIFDYYIPLDLRWIFDSTTSYDLSCKPDMEDIFFVNNHLEALSWKL